MWSGARPENKQKKKVPYSWDFKPPHSEYPGRRSFRRNSKNDKCGLLQKGGVKPFWVNHHEERYPSTIGSNEKLQWFKEKPTPFFWRDEVALRVFLLFIKSKHSAICCGWLRTFSKHDTEADRYMTVENIYWAGFNAPFTRCYPREGRCVKEEGNCGERTMNLAGPAFLIQARRLSMVFILQKMWECLNKTHELCHPCVYCQESYFNSLRFTDSLRTG